MRVRRGEIRKRIRGGCVAQTEESQQPRDRQTRPLDPRRTGENTSPRERSSVQVKGDDNTALETDAAAGAVVIRAIRLDGCVVARRDGEATVIGKQ